MGLITNLVKMKSEKDLQAKEGTIDALKIVLSNPDATPEARQWATTSLVGLLDGEFGGAGKKSGGGQPGGGSGGSGGKSGGKSGSGVGGFFHHILSGLEDANPFTASQGTKRATQQIAGSRPQNLTMTPEQIEAEKTKQADLEAKRAQIKQAALDAQKRVAGDTEWHQIFDRERGSGRTPEQARQAADQAVYRITEREATARDDTLQAYADELGKPVDKLTGAEKVEAVNRNKSTTYQTKYGLIKGREEDGPQPLFLNPRNPQTGYVDADGNTYRAADVSSVSNTPPPQQRMFGRTLEISKYVESKGYKPGTPEYNYWFGKIAAVDLQTSLGRTQQLGAIDAAQSGVGLGVGFPDIPQNPAWGGASGAGGGSVPSAGRGSGSPTAPTPRASTPLPSATGGGSGGGTAAVDPNDKFISMYLGDLFGSAPVSGGAAKVGIIKGREALKNTLGLTAVDFSLLEAMNKEERKAVGDTIQRAVATQRVNRVLDEFGDEVTKRARDIAKTPAQTDIPILNQHVRDIQLAVVGNPALRRFLLALNGFQRQYGILTSGSPQSRAQLPVGVGEKVDKILDPNATLQEVIDSVDQVKVEGRREADGFKNSVKETLGNISGSFGGGRGGGTNTPDKTAPGDLKKLTTEELLRKLGGGH